VGLWQATLPWINYVDTHVVGLDYF
jgi:hypothetical protein